MAERGDSLNVNGSDYTSAGLENHCDQLVLAAIGECIGQSLVGWMIPLAVVLLVMRLRSKPLTTNFNRNLVQSIAGFRLGVFFALPNRKRGVDETDISERLREIAQGISGFPLQTGPDHWRSRTGRQFGQRHVLPSAVSPPSRPFRQGPRDIGGWS